jgi:hypothetical protein
MVEEEGVSSNQGDTITFEFPIRYLEDESPTKNISPSNIPSFNVLSSEDPYSFLFEFDICCRSYEYTTYVQKMKLFPSTLNNVTLHWFMGLGGKSIHIWDDMKFWTVGFH